MIIIHRDEFKASNINSENILQNEVFQFNSEHTSNHQSRPGANSKELSEIRDQ